MFSVRPCLPSSQVLLTSLLVLEDGSFSVYQSARKNDNQTLHSSRDNCILGDEGRGGGSGVSQTGVISRNRKSARNLVYTVRVRYERPWAEPFSIFD